MIRRIVILNALCSVNSNKNILSWSEPDSTMSFASFLQAIDDYYFECGWSRCKKYCINVNALCVLTASVLPYRPHPLELNSKKTAALLNAPEDSRLVFRIRFHYYRFPKYCSWYIDPQNAIYAHTVTVGKEDAAVVLCEAAVAAWMNNLHN